MAAMSLAPRRPESSNRSLWDASALAGCWPEVLVSSDFADGMASDMLMVTGSLLLMLDCQLVLREG